MKISNTFGRIAIGSMIGTTALTISQEALAAFTTYFAARGTKTGQLKSETTQDKRRDKWIPVISFSFGLKSPRDIATGQASGKRQYDQVCVTKELGAATPQLYSIAATNEILSEVSFEFSKTNPMGAEYVFQTIKLTNATVASIKDYQAKQHPGVADGTTVEEVCFTFQKVEIANKDGNTIFADDWRAAGY